MTLLNEVRCHPFSIAELVSTVRQASLAVEGDPQVDQVAYLARYAERLGARTFVVERHYVDRHFIEEFSLYYARCLHPPPSHCTRIHFFSTPLSEEQLDGRLVEAAESTGRKQEVEKKLSEHYLGFAVIRPLPHVPIGRTILRHLDDRVEREIFVTTWNTVHLLGLELSIKGLAFLQQDRAVGACATASLWMAMSRAARLEGGRAPTPAFIAEAASRHTVAEGRAIPSRGLTIPQVTDAIRACGFAPEVLRATGNPQLFLSMLFCYLRSGIPVVLVLGTDEPGGAHAVTAVGYRIGQRRPEFETTLPTRSARIEQLYVHDDRLGPYARASLEICSLPPPEQEDQSSPAALFLHIERDEGAQQEDSLLVRFAIVPVYPKLRMSMEDIWAVASDFSVFMEHVGFQSYCETFFVRAGSYLEELVKLRAEHELELPAERLARFIRQVVLSRWVCVTRWWSPEDRPLADFIYDTTDVVRVPERARALLVGMVAYEPMLRANLITMGRDWDVPVL